MRTALALLFSLGVAGCNSDLPSASMIEKLRVLAVQAEPPEVAPGQTTTLSALVVEPPRVQLDGGFVPSPPSYLWLACTVPANTAEQAPCGLSASQPLPGAGASQAALPPFCQDQPGASLCIVSMNETGTFTPDASLLAGARTRQLLVSVTVADTPEGAFGCLVAAANNQDMPTTPDHCVLALKRLTLTDPTRPLSDGSLPVLNHNPSLTDVRYVIPMGDETSLLDGSAQFIPPPVANDGTVELHALRADDASELVPAFDSAGKVTGSQYEALTVAWFATGGKIDGGRSAFDPPGCATQLDCPQSAPAGDSSTKWEVPTAAALSLVSLDASVRFYAVVRDDRGGVGWLKGSAFTAR